MRPRTLDEYAGQEHLLGAGRPLRTALEQGALHSMIFWGPPGVGKTTLARLIATVSDAHFETLSAVLAGVKDIRQAVDIARQNYAANGRRTILFVDEVHRFNKAQQDAFLPHVEEGTVIFIGATTENPSFELNNALLSRARVYRLRGLERADLDGLLNRALAEPELADTVIEDDARDLLLGYADGDARRLLNMLEIALDLTDGEQPRIDRPLMEEVLRDAVRRFDKGGDVFYDQ
ncbi:MAG TPA: recombination factor protein RarA, partial [Pseudomonas sp.]|nr:recombination factor protein RarA [Pseudomonas sp.]